jgi:hypothetical protein
MRHIVLARKRVALVVAALLAAISVMALEMPSASASYRNVETWGDGVRVRSCPYLTSNCGAVDYINAGEHTVCLQVPGSEVVAYLYGVRHQTFWWMYLPYRHGYVSEAYELYPAAIGYDSPIPGLQEYGRC